jgi:hypothetical protein
LSGLAISRLRVDPGFARFDLALDLEVVNDGVSGYFRYNSEIFDHDTVAGISEEFAHVLSVAAAEPDRRLLEFELQRDWRRGPAPTQGLRNFRRARPDRDSSN